MLELIVIALVGFMLGKFFALWVLIAVTLVTFCFCGYCSWKFNEGLPVLEAMAYWLLSIVGGIVMWLTYYVTTDQTWIQELFIRTLR